MSTTSLPVSASLLSLLFAITALPAQNMAAAPQSPGTSKVRIVRLSEVKGVVQVDRRTGQGFEPAVTNLPIVEQSSLRTEAGVAEVEFEDNSTLRLAPNSVAEFTHLDRLATGATVSEVHLLQGTAYVSLQKTSANQFTLAFGDQKLQLQPASHIRLQVEQTGANLAVFDGNVHLDEAGGVIDVPRKKTVSFLSQDASEPKVTKGIASEAFDSWDKQSTQYHARAASLSAFGNAPYAYGLNDMSYYGSFMDAAGCGMMWRPYFASAAWDPYANGAWAWYPGAGYSWVSPYPWGWTPYHYGSWSYCPNAGWGWVPGGTWNGLNNVAAIGGAGFGGAGTGGGAGRVPPVLPHPPIHPPRLGQRTLTAVNLKPLVVSNVGANNSFVFRRDSAGLGIPRDGLGKLNGFSQRTVRQGMASTPVYMTAGPSAPVAGRPGGGRNPAPLTMHRGNPPEPASSRPMSPGPGYSGNSSQGSMNSAPRSTNSAPRSTMPTGAPSSAGGHMGGGGPGGGPGGGAPGGGAPGGGAPGGRGSHGR